MDTRKAYVLGVASLAAGVLVAIIVLLIWQGARYAAASADSRLDGIRRAQALIEQQKNADIAIRAELMANNQAVVGYIVQALGESLPGMEQDSASITDLLRERREQTGLALIAVLDGDGNAVASTEPFSISAVRARAALFAQAKQDRVITLGVLLDERRLLHAAILPLSSYGFDRVYLLVGQPLDQGMAQSMAEVGQAGIAFMAVGDKRVVTESTLDPALQEALLDALPAGSGETQRLDFRFDGERRHAMAEPLFGSPSARVLGVVSPESGAGFSTALQLPLVVGGLMVLAAVLLAAWWLWTRLIEPVERLGAIISHAVDLDDLFLKASEQGAAPVARAGAAFNRLLQKFERRKTRRRPPPPE